MLVDCCDLINLLFDDYIGYVDVCFVEFMQLCDQFIELWCQCVGEYLVEDCGIVYGFVMMEIVVLVVKCLYFG